MKKVLLVNTNTEQSPYPVPPLGLCLIAGILEKNYDVRIYDGAFDAGKGLPDMIAEFGPDYIGVSIRNIDDMDLLDPTNYIDPIREKFIKPIRNAANVPLILGGSAFSIFPEYFMDYYNADYGIFGEAETAFPLLLQRLDAGGDMSDVPSVFSRDSKNHTLRAADFPMGEVPFSNIDLRIDYTPYRARSSYPVQTKRGCSHRCIYCTYNCIEGYQQDQAP